MRSGSGCSMASGCLSESNGSRVEARVAVRERMLDGACFLIEGTEEGNANSLLNGGGEVVSIEKVGG